MECSQEPYSLEKLFVMNVQKMRNKACCKGKKETSNSFLFGNSSTSVLLQTLFLSFWISIETLYFPCHTFRKKLIQLFKTLLYIIT